MRSEFLAKALLAFILALGVACGGETSAPAPKPDAGTLFNPVDGGSGDAGLPDAGNGDLGSPYTYEPEPEVKALMDKVAKARGGEAVDFDGDGVDEFTRIVEEDGTVVVEVTDADGNLVYFSTTSPDGTRTMVHDSNGDGQSDVELHSTKDPPREVWLRDEGADGYPEWRITLDYDMAAGTVHGKVEHDEDEDGEYVVVKESIEPVSRFAGAPCNPVRPPSGEPGMSGPGGINIQTNADGSGGRCTPDQARKLAKAFGCAFNRGFMCLSATNPRMANAMMETLAGGADLDVSCGIASGCGNLAAADRCRWGICPSPDDDRNRISFNPDALGYDDKDLCSLVLHEFLHIAGEGFEPGHDEGVDRVYSCGRYCAGCSNVAKGAPASSNVDCARCAETEAQKKQCGYKEEVTDGECGSDAPWGICHGGLACLLGRCETCRSIEVQNCEGEPISARFNCCAACPSDCDRSNDFPCIGKPPTENTCDKTPPFCK